MFLNSGSFKIALIQQSLLERLHPSFCSSELTLALSAHTDPWSSLESLSQVIEKKINGANRALNCLPPTEASIFCQNGSSLAARNCPLRGLIRKKLAFSLPQSTYQSFMLYAYKIYLTF